MSQSSIDEYSAAAVPVQMTVNGNSLSIGSGFFWQVADQLYLITNWHNVSGVNPMTGANMSSTGGRPDTIHVGVNAAQPPRRGVLTLPLHDTEGPVWLVHPKLGRRVDVAAVPVRIDIVSHPEARYYPINTLSSRNMQIGIGSDVFIIGYPFAHDLADRGGWPIWKRASVASEPALLREDELYVLVDTASRPGMSGSAVVARTVGDVLLENGDLVMVTGTSTRFFGVYAGRVSSSDALDAQLGRVYPAFFLDEIINGQVRETIV